MTLAANDTAWPHPCQKLVQPAPPSGLREWAKLPRRTFDTDLGPTAMRLLATLMRAEALNRGEVAVWGALVEASGLCARTAARAADELEAVGLVEVARTEGGHRRSVSVDHARKSWVKVPLVDPMALDGLTSPRALWALWGQCLAVHDDGRPWSTSAMAYSIDIAERSARRWVVELGDLGWLADDGTPDFERWHVLLEHQPTRASRRAAQRPKPTAMTAKTDSGGRNALLIDSSDPSLRTVAVEKATAPPCRARQGPDRQQLRAARQLLEALTNRGSQWSPLIAADPDRRAIGALGRAALADGRPPDQLAEAIDANPRTLEGIRHPLAALAHRIGAPMDTTPTRPHRPEPVPLPEWKGGPDGPPRDDTKNLAGIAAARRRLNRGGRL